jgi:dihydroorotate dehydrogenase electron transfer subunit
MHEQTAGMSGVYQEQFTIVSNQEINPGVRLLWLDAPAIASTCRPGQFVMLACSDGGSDHLLRRPISIHRVEDTTVAFLFSIVGEGTLWLAQREASQKIDLLGPMGNGFSIEPDSANLLLIAGGLGIAPLIFLAESALKSGKKVRLLLGAKTRDQLYPPADLPPQIETRLTTEDGSAGTRGLVTSLIPEHAGWADQVFLCGPLPMYRSVVANTPENFKTKSAQLSLEVRMGCGLGFCYACTIKTNLGLKQVCRDGPVFNLNEVSWGEL